jgi:hypothetical protein
MRKETFMVGKEGLVLIGKIDIKAREKILVTIREVRRTRMIDLRVHHTCEDGEMIGTAAGITLLPDQVDQAIELLRDAKTRAEQKPE